jgi:Carboxypeptidase regulatory-like domain
MAKQKLLALVLLLAGIIMVPCGTRGQAVTGTLVGTVTDPTGAVVANAPVSITNEGTAAVASSTSNESGNYNFTFLPPGAYTVTITAPGFQKKVTRGVNVPVNTTTRVDVSLQAGSASQTITVSDQAPLLQTDRADVSAQIESRQVLQLPVGNSQNFQELESLIPGVSAPIFDHSTFDDAQNSESFDVNGQSELSNNLQFEGIDDNERTGLLQVYVPPSAALQTVDVETSNYAPEFGRAAGAVTNVILKSGTNQFHGSGYEFNQISALQARNYFNRTGIFPRDTYNFFGGTFGGPIIKDKTFFFGDYLGYRNFTNTYTLITVPTEAFRAGNLSASPTAIYDPSTGNANGSGRQQFPGNVIPASRISPIANNVMALVPLPNIPGAGATNNYQANPNFHQTSSQFDIKLDQALRTADHLAYRFSWQSTDIVQAPIFGDAGGPASGGGEGEGTNKVFNTALEYTRVISSTLFTELRGGVDHYRNNQTPSGYGSDLATQLGIPGVNVSPFTSGAPTINITNYSEPLIGVGASYPWIRGETNIDFVNNWTKLLGNHSFKFGLEVRRVRDDLVQGQTYGPRGVFTFADGQTGLNTPGSVTSYGNDFASFLLDLPNQVGRDVNVGDASWRQTLYFAFFQDTWQATKALTLTYGLRWEFYPPATPREKGGFSQYNPATNSLEVAGYGNVPRNIGMNTNAKDFEPRLGLALRALPQTVVRAGFGISHTPFQDNVYAFNYPVRQNIVFNPLNSYNPTVESDGVTTENMATGFPPAPQPIIPADGILPNASITSTWIMVDTHYRDPYVVSYNLTVERDLGHGWVGNAAYVGNVGRHIPGNYNLNAGFVAGAGAAGQPQYATLGRTASTEILPKGTSSNYNSLQARLSRRLSNNLIATTGYAWQKALGFNSSTTGLGTYNFYIDFQRNYAPTTWDRRQTFVQSFVYSLPFGKGQRFLPSGPAAGFLGGWQVSGILSADAGTPMLFLASSSQLNAPSNDQVPNQIAPFRRLKAVGTTQDWFNTSAFVQPAGAAFGNMGQNVYSGPGLVAFDASLQKDFPIHENIGLTMRLQGFNALNHPIFANPNTTLTSSSFGQVTSTLGSGGTSIGSRAMQVAATLHF